MNPTIAKLGIATALWIGMNASALAWWSCPTGGYNLEVRPNNNQHVRCFRQASTQDNPISTNCPKVKTPLGTIGSSFKRDHYPGGADACVTKDPTGTASTAVPHNFCPNGGTYTPVSGANDVCRVSTPVSEVGPTSNVN
ncbi:MAG: hypothetical protein R6X17_15825 [Candidatus Competibacteraceae bacterium]